MSEPGPAGVVYSAPIDRSSGLRRKTRIYGKGGNGKREDIYFLNKKTCCQHAVSSPASTNAFVPFSSRQPARRTVAGSRGHHVTTRRTQRVDSESICLAAFRRRRRRAQRAPAASPMTYRATVYIMRRQRITAVPAQQASQHYCLPTVASRRGQSN